MILCVFVLNIFVVKNDIGNIIINDKLLGLFNCECSLCEIVMCVFLIKLILFILLFSVIKVMVVLEIMMLILIVLKCLSDVIY